MIDLNVFCNNVTQGIGMIDLNVFVIMLHKALADVGWCDGAL